MSGLNIGIVSHNFPPHVGGVELTAWQHAAHLARRGHRVTVWTSELPEHLRGAEIHDPPGVEVRRLKPAFRLKNMPLTPQLARLRDHDVIHLHAPFLFGEELVLVGARMRRQPIVISYHSGQNNGSWRRLLKERTASAAAETYIRHLSLRTAGRAAHLCLVSEDQADHPSSPTGRYLRRHPQRRAFVPHGVDTDLFTPKGERERYGSGERPVAVWCGRLDATSKETKRLDIALEASAQAGVDLVVLGDGEERPGWERYARRLGIGDRVHFLGAVPRERVAAVYRGADLLLSSSVSEGRPLAITEAMSCGMTVVVPAIVGLNSLIDDGRNGFLYEPGDPAVLAEAIREAIEADRPAIGRAARELIERELTWDRSAERLERVLREACGK